MTPASAASARLSGYAAHPVCRIDPLRRPDRVTAKAGVRDIASSARTIIVDEQDHALIAYFPRVDVDMSSLMPLAVPSTHCPFKGDARYWTLADSPGEPIAWSYAEPYAEVAAIAGHIAFYQESVEVCLGIKAWSGLLLAKPGSAWAKTTDVRLTFDRRRQIGERAGEVGYLQRLSSPGTAGITDSSPSASNPAIAISP